MKCGSGRCKVAKSKVPGRAPTVTTRTVVVGGPTLGRDYAEAWRACLASQEVEGWRVVVMPMLDEGHEQAGDYDPQRHSWTASAMRRVGRLRSAYVEAALAAGADAVLLCDDDILMGPGVLACLLQHDAPIVYGVFWTVTNSGLRPQVWERHPNTLSIDGARALADGLSVEVYGGGACTLLRGEALQLYRWEPLPGLPREYLWQGEDRAACVRATVHGLRQVAVGAVGSSLVHLYYPEQREPAYVADSVSRLWGDNLSRSDEAPGEERAWQVSDDLQDRDA